MLKDSMKRLTANILREIENPYRKVLVENYFHRLSKHITTNIVNNCLNEVYVTLPTYKHPAYLVDHYYNAYIRIHNSKKNCINDKTVPARDSRFATCRKWPRFVPVSEA